MKEEDKLIKKVGTGNPFAAPGGYFENLTSEVMNKLPEKEDTGFVMKKVTMWDKIKPWAYMAAMFVGAALIIRVASGDHAAIASVDVVEAESPDYEEYIDYAVNQSMLDDYSLYVYLSGAIAD